LEFIKNISQGKYGFEGEVFFRLFGQYINFTVDGSAQIDYVERCAVYLNSLPETVIDALCRASIRYCNDFLSTIKESGKYFEKPEDVLSLIYPSVLIVPDPENGDDPVIHLELNCEWEEEHGLEWIIRGNRVLYVGSFNGMNPWKDYSTKDSWNYA
jgi:hypothetical protein